MSKIKELLTNENSVLVFDIDGVLAVLEWGEHTHFVGDEADWDSLCEKGINTYTQERVSPKMQKFLEPKNKANVYVITMAYNENEKEFKKEYAKKYYNIPKENVYCVEKNRQKTETLKKIKEKYPNLEDRYLIMIDDTTEILDDIMTRTNFSTAHISSFLDIM